MGRRSSRRMLKWLFLFGAGPQGGGGLRHLQAPPTLTPHHDRLPSPHLGPHRRRLTPKTTGLWGKVDGCGGDGGGLGVCGGGSQSLDGPGRFPLHPTPGPPRNLVMSAPQGAGATTRAPRYLVMSAAAGNGTTPAATTRASTTPAPTTRASTTPAPTTTGAATTPAPTTTGPSPPSYTIRATDHRSAVFNAAEAAARAVAEHEAAAAAAEAAATCAATAARSAATHAAVASCSGAVRDDIELGRRIQLWGLLGVPAVTLQR